MSQRGSLDLVEEITARVLVRIHDKFGVRTGTLVDAAVYEEHCACVLESRTGILPFPADQVPQLLNLVLGIFVNWIICGYRSWHAPTQVRMRVYVRGASFKVGCENRCRRVVVDWPQEVFASRRHRAKQLHR